MTNIEAKSIAIKKAYGDIWDKVKELVRDFDGTIETFPFLMQEGHESDGFYWRELGLSYDDIEDVYGDCDPSRWRPISLKGIEINAGWTRIEPDGSNLPIQKGYERFKVIINRKVLRRECFISEGKFYYLSPYDKCEVKEPSHYKPIEKELLPIY